MEKYSLKMHVGKYNAWYMKRVWKLQCEFADGKVDARARLYVIWLLKFYIVKKAAYVIFIVFFFFSFF